MTFIVAATGISATGLFLGGTALVGGYLASQGASHAADTAANASTQASDASIAEQRRQYDLARSDTQAYRDVGTNAVNQLGVGLQPGGRFAAAPRFNFNYNQNTDPSYAWQFDEGMRGVNAVMAAGGLRGSGAAIKGATRYGQGMASKSYTDAFNRYVTEYNADVGAQNTEFNRLSGAAGTGQTATNQVNTLGANMAGNVGNAYMNNAANVGNAAMAASGQRNSAYSSVGNMLGRFYGPQLAGGNTYQGIAQAGNYGYVNPIDYGSNYG